MGLSKYFFILSVLPTCLHVLTYTIAFGFAAALVESLPIVGLIFTISNRIGAAMWAHGLSSYPVHSIRRLFAHYCAPNILLADLEKRQHFVAAKLLQRSQSSGLGAPPPPPSSFS